MKIRRTRHHEKKEAYAKIENPLRRWTLRVLDGLDLLIYALVGLAFFVAALLALGFSVENLLNDFAIKIPLPGVVQDVLSFVSDLLLVLIIMEVLSTVRSYLEKGDTSVKPFLFIGIISATRGILSIGARLSIQSPPLTGDDFRNAIIELGIDALVIIVLGVTIRVMGTAADLPADPEPAQADAHTDSAHDHVKVETTITSLQHHDSPHAQEPS